MAPNPTLTQAQLEARQPAPSPDPAELNSAPSLAATYVPYAVLLGVPLCCCVCCVLSVPRPPRRVRAARKPLATAQQPVAHEDASPARPALPDGCQRRASGSPSSADSSLERAPGAASDAGAEAGVASQASQHLL